MMVYANIALFRIFELELPVKALLEIKDANLQIQA
jgi:hypothetical protein